MVSQISLVITLLLVFVAAIGGGILAKKLKLPMLAGYILAGIFLGNVLPRVIDTEFLHVLADVGLTLLLFTLGIEFSFHRLSRLLKPIVWAASLQVLICTLIFSLIFVFFGLPFLAALYLGAAASLSSTAVMVKILSERGELETVPGETLTAWSLMQDLAVVPMMIILPTLSVIGTTANTSIAGSITLILLSIVKAIIALVIIVVLGKNLIRRALNLVASLGSSEIFLLTTVGIVIICAAVSFIFGLSAALGAFIAGLLVSETSQNHAIFAEVRPLRDLFAVIFFVALGLTLPIVNLLPLLWLLTAMLVIVFLVKWIVVVGLARFLGYHRKTAVLVALGLGQMSEFSFVLTAVGLSSGAITQDQALLLVALTLLTIIASSPLIAHGQAIYYWLSQYLPKIFPENNDETINNLPQNDHIIICGFGRVGKYIGRALDLAAVPFVIIDYNHANVAKLRQTGYKVIFGDPAEKDLLAKARVENARALVIAIPDHHTQSLVIANAQTLNKRIMIICRSHFEEDHRHLKSLGVGLIVQPEFEAALSITASLLNNLGLTAEEISTNISQLQTEHGLG